MHASLRNMWGGENKNGGGGQQNCPFSPPPQDLKMEQPLKKILQSEGNIFFMSLRLTLMIMYEEVSLRFPTWAGA